MRCACCGKRKRFLESFEELDNDLHICVNCSKKLYKYQDLKKEGNIEECEKLIKDIDSTKSSQKFKKWLNVFIKRLEENHEDTEEVT